METKGIIKRYTRNRKGQLNGCLVAGVVDGKVRIGYSKCHRNDVFDKKMARELATARMLKTEKDYTTTLPASMIEDLKRFTDRCSRYFKTV
jgi:hypothetical protein